MKARELLDDGEWHDLERVLAKLMPLVPPGQAYRKAEKSRVKKRSVDGVVPPRVKHRADDAIIRSGSRQLVFQVLHSGSRGRPSEFELDPPRRVLGSTERRRIRLNKDSMAYIGYRKPEDVPERVRQTLDLLLAGYRQMDIAEQMGISEHSVSASLRHAMSQVGQRPTSTPTLVLQAFWDRGLLPRYGPMSRLELEFCADVRRNWSIGVTPRAKLLNVSVDELVRVRRRLMFRFGIPRLAELERAIWEGKVP